MNHPAPTRRRVTVLLLGISAALTGLLAAAHGEPGAPRESDSQVAIVVAQILGQDHMSGLELDDEISRRTARLFIRSLDPLKLYFERSDVDEFVQREAELDDMIQEGDVSFAYDVFHRYLDRVEERVALVEQLVAEPHDFTLDETMVTDAEQLDYCAGPEEVRERWRQRIKYELLRLRIDGMDDEAARERVLRRYHARLSQTRQVTEDDLLEMYLNALAMSFDPHSNYLSPNTLQEFEIQLQLELEGIGAGLRQQDGITTVNEIIPGGAAEKDGRLQVGDQIVGVGQGEDGEMVDVTDMRLSDAVQLIRGPRGTMVRLEVIPAGSAERRVYELVRQRIELHSSEAQGEIIEHNGRRIGVLRIPSFYLDFDGARSGREDYANTTRDVRRVLEGFNEEQVDGVIVDLRSNGGGALQEAIRVSGLFIDEGPVVQVMDFQGRVRQLDDTDSGAVYTGPLMVVVNRESASASEIFAGVIRDYERGIIVGDETTHGKGTVQQIIELGPQLFGPGAPEMGAIKLTIQQFYRVNGDSTQNRGVPADVVLPSTLNHREIGEEHLDYAMPFDRIDAVEHDRLGLVSPGIVEELCARCDGRCAESPEFQEVLRDIAREEQLEERGTISLNEAVLREELAGYEDEEDEAPAPSSAEVFERNFYNNELLAIMGDYLSLLERPTNAAIGR